MKKQHFYSLFFIVLLALPLQLTAQEDIRIKKRDFKIEKSTEGFPEAWREVRRGNRLYERGKNFYSEALIHYLEAYQYNSGNAELNYKVGTCYLFSIGKVNAINYLEKAYELNDSVSTDIHLMLGKAFQLTYQFDKAIDAYNQYKMDMKTEMRKRRFVTKAQQNELTARLEIVDKMIQECNTGKEMIASPVRVMIENLGPSVNSSYPEYSPYLDYEAGKLYFTSRRMANTGKRLNHFDNRYFEDVFFSLNIDEEWERTALVGKPINVKQNDAIIGISPDGSRLFLYKGKRRHGDIFYSDYDTEDDEWGRVKRLRGPKINTRRYHETSASVTADGKTLYFVSNREKGAYGGHDIYYSTLDEETEKWTEPVNAGNFINTPFDEISVFIHPNGHVMYFCSNGHNTMGGYDVFRAELNDRGQWSEPVNVGYPINTPDNEMSYYTFGTEKQAFYSSIRESGFGTHDIYEIFYMGEEKPSYQSNDNELIAVEVEPEDETIILETIEGTYITGIVLDEKTKEPVIANVGIVNMENSTQLETISTNADGTFSVSLPEGNKLQLRINATGYFFSADSITVQRTQEYQEVNADTIFLKPIEIGSKLVLRNVFFDTGKSNLRPESFPELENLYEVLKMNPTLRIEIGGHTDNTGRRTLNEKLSQARADAVRKYLLERGISPDRLEAKGYADDEPIATNDTPEGRQLNRRVEAKVIGN